MLYPSDPAKKPPLRIGLAIGIATLTHIKKFGPSYFCLLSTSSTTPKRLLNSTATVGEAMSKGTPHICIHKETESNLTLLADILNFLLINIRTWLSKVHGPPLRIRSISNSYWILNWKRFDPTSTICTRFSNPTLSSVYSV